MDHNTVKLQGLDSRYLPPEGILGLIDSFSTEFHCETIGHSVEERPIQTIKIGHGSLKILMWSQMHGNETTTTRALLDLINMFQLAKGEQKEWLEKLTILVIPMLNPDGAIYYTRRNANDVDLNRDAQALSQPETKALFTIYQDFQPDFCFNLHGQRTRYAVGESEVPTTLAFLAPSADTSKTITDARKQAMQLIVGIHSSLQSATKIGMARYDDAFNAQCVGDAFTAMGTPTILFEAGHYPGDYHRHMTRKYLYDTLYSALKLIATAGWTNIEYSMYFDIPENKTSYADIVLKNNNTGGTKTQLALNYDEQLIDGQIVFVPKPISESYAPFYIGHKIFDLQNEKDVDTLRSDTHLSAFI
ncbi:MAG: DUF2817 domain-containing protein [Flavobacteriaceae bacterium]|nr:DUF2817 domain-containing protein [Flavobacteriaceae bacterium]